MYVRLPTEIARRVFDDINREKKPEIGAVVHLLQTFRDAGSVFNTEFPRNMWDFRINHQVDFLANRLRLLITVKMHICADI